MGILEQFLAPRIGLFMPEISSHASYRVGQGRSRLSFFFKSSKLMSSSNVAEKSHHAEVLWKNC